MKIKVVLVLFVTQINFAQAKLPVGNLEIVNDGAYNSSINSGNAARIDMGFDGVGYLKFGAHTGYGQRADILYMRGNDGNVGIGTSVPSAKLDVLGDVKSYNVTFGQIDAITSSKNYANFSTNNHGSVLISSNLYVSGNDIMKIANTHDSMSGGAILIPGNSQPNQGKIQFFTTIPSSVIHDQLYSGSVSMEIAENGNVGIGISNPKNKLDVNGTIHSKEIKIDLDKWPDYVFKKEYNLPTLQEVENHIIEKGYLINMPNEADVLREGINLGKMNVKLLEKIEELTLYVIEQNKEISLLKKQNMNMDMVLFKLQKLQEEMDLMKK